MTWVPLGTGSANVIDRVTFAPLGTSGMAAAPGLKRRLATRIIGGGAAEACCSGLPPPPLSTEALF